MRSSLATALANEHALLQKIEASDKLIAEREFILSHTQKLAKTGSWSFDRQTQRTSWSDEMYNIHGLNFNFDTDNYLAVLNLYDDNSRAIMLDAGKTMYETKKPFDIIARIVTPLGYTKWVRVVGYPTIRRGEVSGIIGITSDITVAKHAEEIIKESEEKFASAFRNNPDLMVITREADRLIVDVNEKVFTVLGYTREEVLGKESSEFNFYVNPDDRNTYFSAFANKGKAEIECPWQKKNGEVIHVIITSSRLKVRGTNYIITVIKDVSARKRAEVKFQKVFELSPDLMFLVRLDDFKIIEANSKLKEILGYDHEQILGKATTDFDLWVDLKAREDFLERLKSGNASLVTQLKKKNGTVFHGSITSSLVQLDGETHFICVIRDITEYIEAQKKIQQSELNLSAIINNTDMEIWSIDKDLRIIAVNDNFRQTVKKVYDVDLELNSDLNRCFKEKLDPEKFDMWVNLYQLALTGASVSLTNKRNDDMIHYSLHPIRKGDDIVGIVCYAKTITEIIHKVEALEAADKRIAELQLTTLRAFMNPHFIFNALNSIQYFISINNRQKAISYLSTFSILIRKVLSSAQRNNISLKDEMDMLQHYVDIEKLRFNNQFDMVLNIGDEVMLSELQIPSLLIQPFVENAIIHAFSQLKHKGIITVSINRKDDLLNIEVKDNGIGRAAAEKLRLTRNLKHESSAILIASERLRLINRNNNVSVNYEDLIDAGLVSGTKVTIKVRLENLNDSNE